MSFIYKYAGLSSCLQVSRVIDCLRLQKFWFSKFHELNDPMEGIFMHYASDVNKAACVTRRKNQYIISSFGSSDDNSTLWAYYASGFQGICIGVDNGIASDEMPIFYCDAVQFNQSIDFSDLPDAIAKRLLSTKLRFWEPENEIRVYKKQKTSGLKKIGKIKCVVFGRNMSVKILDDIICAIKISPHMYDSSSDRLLIYVKIAIPKSEDNDFEKVKIIRCENLDDLRDNFEQYYDWRENNVKKI